MGLRLMFLVLYSFWWTVQLKLLSVHDCALSLYYVCVGFFDGGGGSSVPEPLVNEDTQHNKKNDIADFLRYVWFETQLRFAQWQT